MIAASDYRERVLFTDAIIGVGFPRVEVAVEAARQGLAVFSGSQHNEAWSWQRHKLEAMSLDALVALYASLKRVA